MSKYRWIYTTWPDADSAGTAANILLAEHLCACVNILPGMTSLYSWQGQVETSREAVMILKTSADRAGALTGRLAALHPYDEPCIIALGLDDAASSPGFLAWIDAAVTVQD